MGEIVFSIVCGLGLVIPGIIMLQVISKEEKLARKPEDIQNAD